jgi:hypothetical protein
MICTYIHYLQMQLWLDMNNEPQKMNTYVWNMLDTIS